MSLLSDRKAGIKNATSIKKTKAAKMMKKFHALGLDDYSKNINFDDVFEKEKFVSKHFLGPRQPTHIALVGKTGSGKSNHLLRLLTCYLKFDRLYLFCRIKDENKNDLLVNWFAEMKEKAGPGEFYPTLTISTNLKDVPSFEQILAAKKKSRKLGHTGRTGHTVIVFNDLVFDDHRPMLDFFVSGRHLNISAIFVSQYYFRNFPIKIRSQCSDVMIFSLGKDNRKVRMLADVYAGNIPKDEFVQLYEHATRGYNFLYIDTRAKDINLYLRKNMNGLYRGTPICNKET